MVFHAARSVTRSLGLVTLSYTWRPKVQSTSQQRNSVREKHACRGCMLLHRAASRCVYKRPAYLQQTTWYMVGSGFLTRSTVLAQSRTLANQTPSEAQLALAIERSKKRWALIIIIIIKTLMFLDQAGTFLSFQARRSSAKRSSTSNLTVVFLMQNPTCILICVFRSRIHNGCRG